MSANFKNYSVLQVLPHLDSGGLVSGAIEISKALTEKKLGSYIASSGGSRSHEVVRNGAKIFNIPVNSKNPFKMYRNISRIKRLIIENNINIIHARSRAPAWSAKFASNIMNIPFVTTFHGTYGISTNLKKKYNSIMTNADKVIAISDFIAKHITKEYGTDSNKIRVIPRGVDLSVFNPLKVREAKLYEIANKYNLNSDMNHILLPARMTRWKGHELFIDAISMIKKENITCMFVGDFQNKGSYVKELEQKIKNLGLTNKFRFLGHQSDMAAVYKLADVVVSASTKPEAFGRVVAESLAMGRLTIAVNHGGGPEIIKNQETGWLFKAGNARDLSKKLLLALSQTQEDRIKISNKSISLIKNKYDIKFMCDKTLELYDELIAEKKQKKNP